MPRFYNNPVKPSTNKAVSPVTETKGTGKDKDKAPPANGGKPPQDGGEGKDKKGEGSGQ